MARFRLERDGRRIWIEPEPEPDWVQIVLVVLAIPLLLMAVPFALLGLMLWGIYKLVVWVVSQAAAENLEGTGDANDDC